MLKETPTQDCISRLKGLIHDYEISPENTYAMKPDLGFKRSKSKEREKLTLWRPAHPENDARDIGSAIFCISRTGRFLNPYVILKGRKSMGFEPKYGSDFTTNPLGWADEYDFNEWFENFFQCETRPENVKKGRGPWRLLIVSHPYCRLNERFFVSCRQNRIICFSLSMKNAKDLDPFLCGVTDYIEERYTEKLQGRWVKRDDKNAVRLKSSTFVNTFSKMAIDCGFEEERISVIGKAWEECALFSSSSTSDSAKATSLSESEIARQGKVEEVQPSVHAVADDEHIGWLEDTSLSIAEPLSSHTAAPLSTQQATPSPVKPVKKQESSSPNVNRTSLHRSQPQLAAGAESLSSTAAQPSQGHPSSDQAPRPSKRQKQGPSRENGHHGQSNDATIKNPNRIPIPAWPRDPGPEINHPPTAPRALLDRQSLPTANGGQISRSTPSSQTRPERGRNHQRFASGSPPVGGQESRPRNNQPGGSSLSHGRDPSRPRSDQPRMQDTVSRRSPSRPRNDSSTTVSNQQSRPQNHSSNTNSNSRKRSRPRSRNGQPGVSSPPRHRDQSRPRSEHAHRRDRSRPSGGAYSTSQRNQDYPQRYRPTTPRSSPNRPLSPAHRGGNRPYGSEVRPGNGLFAPGSGSQAQTLEDAMRLINRQHAMLQQMEAKFGLGAE